MVTALIFIAVIGVLVIVHEFGHFIVAKRAGMKVEEFGFGFPPRLFSIKRGETVYSLNLIPFGGFVKIYGEDGRPAAEVDGALSNTLSPSPDSRRPAAEVDLSLRRRDPSQNGKEEVLTESQSRHWAAKPIGTRLKVIVAGVAMNFLLAVFLLMLGNYVGIRVGIGDEMDDISATAKDKMVQVVSVIQNSPADQAGLKIFDEIIGFSTAQEVRDYIAVNAGGEIALTVRRDSQIEIKQILLPESDEGDGLLGIVPVRTGLLSYPWYESMWRGLTDAVFLTGQVAVGYFQLFKTLLLKGQLLADVSGPIGIAVITGQAAAVGFRFLIQFVALISVNLAILNLIPFPALDGGRALMLIIEKFKGSPVNQKVETAINSVGFVLLILLMIYATVKDVTRIF